MDVALNTNKIKPSSIVGRTLSLYEDMDKFVDSCSKPMCIDNCNYCCSDYFYISEWEFYTILYYLEKNFDNDYLSKKIEYSMKCLKCIEEQYPSELKKLNSFNRIFNSNEVYEILRPEIKLRIKCPFLNINKCEIYEVRPLMCREFGTFKHCQCKQLIEMEHIDINNFNDNNRINRIIFPNGIFRKQYPIIDWLGSMTIPILISNKLKLSYTIDASKFFTK